MFSAALLALTLVSNSPTVDVARMGRDLAKISSPAFGGRMTLSPYMQKTADFLAAELRRAGLEPAGRNGTYFHDFEVTINRVATPRNLLTIGGRALRLGEDFLPCNGSTDMRLVRGRVVYVGFARDADLQDKSLDAMVAVALRGMPDDTNDAMSSKAARLAAKGAAAVLFVGPEQTGGSELAPLASGFSVARGGIPAATVHRKWFRDLVGLDFAEARRTGSTLATATLPEVRLVTESAPQTGRAINVIAKLPGRDPSNRELLVVGAHYDHLGFGETSSRTGHDSMHAGADDNGSGTVTVLEIARTLARAKLNQRPILFQFYSGEEIGLLGSRAWTLDNESDLGQIQAMVNLDMVGRLRAEGLTIYGTGTAAEMDAILDRAAPGQLKLARQTTSPSNSDHASFSTRGVPVLFFNTGLHDEYHTERDVFGTINVAGMGQVGDYVIRTILQLDQAPKLGFTGSRQAGGASGDPSRPRRVRFGVQPDMNEVSGKGLMVNGVTADSPAAKAGIKTGDRLLSIGGKAVNNVQDLQQILVEAKAGVPLEVVLMRGDQELKLTVTPEAPVGG
ncbi:MAG: M20/M25/M40 family metallo-hydrolase [Chthonomonas sp.]|nr:M20/M25/M40 family metallo-hydrolase [Chthonomonas sp.]